MASAANQLPPPLPFERVSQAATLRGAWAHVRRAAERSSSRAVRLEARRFEHEADQRLERIAAELREERFAFGAGRGVAVVRPGKRPRPLVVAPVESRVVTRALLDVLQTEPGIAAGVLSVRSSFGGLPGRGVEQAVGAALDAIGRGAVFYVRSDIAEFFRAIPRARAMSTLAGSLAGGIADARLLHLLDLATRTELDNL